MLTKRLLNRAGKPPEELASKAMSGEQAMGTSHDSGASAQLPFDMSVHMQQPPSGEASSAGPQGGAPESLPAPGEPLSIRYLIFPLVDCQLIDVENDCAGGVAR